MTAGGFVLAISSAEAALRVHGVEAEPGRAAMSLAFWVDDVDATFDAVTAAGATAVTAPHDAGNSNRNAVVRDPDLDTLHRRLDQRPPDEWGSEPSARDLIVRLHRTKEDVPGTGVVIDATQPLADVVDEILRHMRWSGADAYR